MSDSEKIQDLYAENGQDEKNKFESRDNFVLEFLKSGSKLVKNAANSAFYAAIADPLKSLAQISDHLGQSSQLSKNLSSGLEQLGMERPEQVKLFSENWLDWHVQQVAAAAGMMLPFMLVKKGVQAGTSNLAHLFSPKIGNSVENNLYRAMGESPVLSKPFLSFTAKEAGLSAGAGFAYGNLLKSVDDNIIGSDNFAKEKALNGGIDAVTFGILGLTSPFVSRGLSTYAQKLENGTSALAGNMSQKLAQTLRLPILSGMISGVPAGLVSTELEAQRHGEQLSWQDRVEGAWGMAFVGGAFAQAHWLSAQKPGTNMTNARYLSNKIGITRENNDFTNKAEYKLFSGAESLSDFENGLQQRPENSAQVQVEGRQKIQGFWSGLFADKIASYGASSKLILDHRQKTDKVKTDKELSQADLIATCAYLQEVFQAKDILPRRHSNNSDGSVWMRYDRENSRLLFNSDPNDILKSNPKDRDKYLKLGQDKDVDAELEQLAPKLKFDKNAWIEAIRGLSREDVDLVKEIAPHLSLESQKLSPEVLVRQILKLNELVDLRYEGESIDADRYSVLAKVINYGFGDHNLRERYALYTILDHNSAYESQFSSANKETREKLIQGWTVSRIFPPELALKASSLKIWQQLALDKAFMDVLIARKSDKTGLDSMSEIIARTEKSYESLIENPANEAILLNEKQKPLLIVRNYFPDLAPESQVLLAKAVEWSANSSDLVGYVQKVDIKAFVSNLESLDKKGQVRAEAREFLEAGEKSFGQLDSSKSFDTFGIATDALKLANVFGAIDIFTIPGLDLINLQNLPTEYSKGRENARDLGDWIRLNTNLPRKTIEDVSYLWTTFSDAIKALPAGELEKQVRLHKVLRENRASSESKLKWQIIEHLMNTGITRIPNLTESDLAVILKTAVPKMSILTQIDNLRTKPREDGSIPKAAELPDSLVWERPEIEKLKKAIIAWRLNSELDINDAIELGKWFEEKHKIKGQALGSDIIDGLGLSWAKFTEQIKNLPTETLIEQANIIRQLGLQVDSINVGRGKLNKQELANLDWAIKLQSANKLSERLLAMDISDAQAGIKAWRVDPRIDLDLAIEIGKSGETWKAVAASLARSSVEDSKHLAYSTINDDASIVSVKNPIKPEQTALLKPEYERLVALGPDELLKLSTNKFHLYEAVRHYQGTLEPHLQELLAFSLRAIPRGSNLAKEVEIVRNIDPEEFKKALSILDPERSEIYAKEYRTGETIDFSTNAKTPEKYFFVNTAAMLPLILGKNNWQSWLDRRLKFEYGSDVEREQRGNDDPERIIAQLLPTTAPAELKGLGKFLIENERVDSERLSTLTKHWQFLNEYMRSKDLETLLGKPALKLQTPHNAIGEIGILESHLLKASYASKEQVAESAYKILNSGFANLPVSEQLILLETFVRNPSADKHLRLQNNVADLGQQGKILYNVEQAIQGWSIYRNFPVDLAASLGQMDGVPYWHKVAARLAWKQVEKDIGKSAEQLVEDGLRTEKGKELYEKALAQIISENDARVKVARHSESILEAVKILQSRLSFEDQILLAQALQRNEIKIDRAVDILKSLNPGSYKLALDDLDSGGFTEILRTKQNQFDLNKGLLVDKTFPEELAYRAASMDAVAREALKIAWAEIKLKVRNPLNNGLLSEGARHELEKLYAIKVKEVARQRGAELRASDSAANAGKVNAEPNRDQIERIRKFLNLPEPDRSGDRAAKLLQGYEPSVIENAIQEFVQSGGPEQINLKSVRAQIKEQVETGRPMTFSDWNSLLSQGANWQHSAALGLAATFGNQSALWLKEASRLYKNSEQKTHDSTYWLPQENTDRLKGLDGWLFSHKRQIENPEFSVKVKERNGEGKIVEVEHKMPGLKALELVSNKWRSFTEEEKAFRFYDLVRIARMSNYEGVISQELALLAKSFGVNPGFGEGEFNYIQNRVLASLNTPSPFPLGESYKPKQEPAVVPKPSLAQAQGQESAAKARVIKSWKSGDYVGEFIPRSDFTGIFLGEIVGCCQHPRGEARAIAWYAQESPNAGFFVVREQGKANSVKAMSAALISPDGGLILDSIESLGFAGKDKVHVAKIYQNMADYFTQETKQFHTVTTSTAARYRDLQAFVHEPQSDLAVAGVRDWPQAKQDKTNLSLSLPSDFSGYNDSTGSAYKQVVISHNSKIAKKAPDLPAVYVKGATEKDLRAAINVAKAVYPEGEHQIEPGNFAFVLYDREKISSISGQGKKGDIVGYATLDMQQKQVYDLAILPDYKKLSESNKLVEQLIETVKQAGGIWHMEARESTSYALLIELAKQGKIELMHYPKGQDKPEIVTDFKVYKAKQSGKAGNELIYSVYFRAKSDELPVKQEK